MYPSGRWSGFWQQEGWGRQSMRAFELRFEAGRVTGSGVDVVGPFSFHGRYDELTGDVDLVKQYLGAHRVTYRGRPDGEGCIQGTWSLTTALADYAGPFLMRPELPGTTERDVIRDFRSRPTPKRRIRVLDPDSADIPVLKPV